MPEKGSFYKIDFEYLEEGNLLISFSEKDKESAFESWKIPGHVVDELITWWKSIKSCVDKGLQATERVENCEFSINRGKYIEVEELFKYSSPKINFWAISKETVEELVCWAERSG